MYKVEQKKGNAADIESWLNAKATAGFRLVGIGPADRGANYIFEAPVVRSTQAPPSPALAVPAKPKLEGQG